MRSRHLTCVLMSKGGRDVDGELDAHAVRVQESRRGLGERLRYSHPHLLIPHQVRKNLCNVLLRVGVHFVDVFAVILLFHGLLKESLNPTLHAALELLRGHLNAVRVGLYVHLREIGKELLCGRALEEGVVGKIGGGRGGRLSPDVHVVHAPRKHSAGVLEQVTSVGRSYCSDYSRLVGGERASEEHIKSPRALWIVYAGRLKVPLRIAKGNVGAGVHMGREGATLILVRVVVVVIVHVSSEEKRLLLVRVRRLGGKRVLDRSGSKVSSEGVLATVGNPIALLGRTINVGLLDQFLWSKLIPKNEERRGGRVCGLITEHFDRRLGPQHGGSRVSGDVNYHGVGRR
mmetsp:Transcript_12257/g.25122  ORF Transcript_12257/g.25122 Transcript_12257/m.25122 type:complete len:345 (-) Transcript_12257:1282-2316(-)